MNKAFLILLILALPVFAANPRMTMKAKAAFAAVSLCECKDCDCGPDCQCTSSTCTCSYDVLYKRAVQKEQPIVLAVGVPLISGTPWNVVPVKSIPGEASSYIVGVPKDGRLIRLDFPPGTSRDRIRLNILHVYYPLEAGYMECPTCPQGRIKMASST